MISYNRYRNSASKTLTRATQSIMFSCSQLHTADMATGGVSPSSLRSLMSREGCTGSHACNIRLCITRIHAAESVNERGADGCDTAKRRADDTKSGSALLCYIISHCINLL